MYLRHKYLPQILYVQAAAEALLSYVLQIKKKV